MKYEIQGNPMPVLFLTLNQGEQVITQCGGMSWMSDGMLMETKSNGGIGKMVIRNVTGEALFQNVYTAQRNGAFIAVASTLVGNIMAVPITPDKPIICQKGSFLACTQGVEMSLYVNNKLSAAFFGGEGIFMQKLSGTGLAFLEVDGSCFKYNLQPNQKIVVDTGHLAMLDASCQMTIESVKGVKNVLAGGEGFFNTVVTGPGQIVVQSMTLPAVR